MPFVRLLHHLRKFFDERIAMDDQVTVLLRGNDCATSKVSSFFVPEFLKQK